MGVFPRVESAKLELAYQMIQGLANNMNDFPSPPVSSSDLYQLLNSVMIGRGQAQAKYAAMEAAATKKQESLRLLVEGMTKVLRYAETTVHFDDDLLKLLGWGGRHPRTPLVAPGQVRELICIEQGPGWITLAWKRPNDKIKVQSYRLDRRMLGESDWLIVGTSLKKQVTLREQTRGVTWEYSVVAVNRVDEGLRSNVVTAVL